MVQHVHDCQQISSKRCDCSEGTFRKSCSSFEGRICETGKIYNDTSFYLDSVMYNKKQSSPGIFSMLPLGLRTLEKICGIIDQEMKAIGKYSSISEFAGTYY